MHRSWSIRPNEIGKGFPRPKEDDLIVLTYGVKEDWVRYLASLGLPIVHCNIYTARVFPELLDVLQDPNVPINVNVDITKDASIFVNEDLLDLVIDTRPDLHESIRKFVLGAPYLNLMFKMNIGLEELPANSQIITKDILKLHRHAHNFGTTLEVFYPMVIYQDSIDIFEQFYCPQLLEYCVNKWSEVRKNIRTHLIITSDPETVIRFFTEDI